ncbi:formaldehyde-responsive transcriptional repressor FrmR [Luteimonas aquatica]|uniref:formaldehyde-responsive transcriptional repressor FrmR n=1 Tax=Luteimonas aquatica TaxID=450364 RepID=UPI001F55E0A0|nr:formaldehyde-responsive transcriptional repressor FrmR [Luteimonas aquatica]
MPHSPQEKKRALTRLRRIRGQAEALERALEQGAECGAVLQQLAAIRGAVNGLMAEVLESHLREEFGDAAGRDAGARRTGDRQAGIDQAIALVRSYLK